MVTVKSVFCGEELILETGLLAKQAHGSVTLRLGNTTILATVVAAKEPNLEFLEVSSKEKLNLEIKRYLFPA